MAETSLGKSDTLSNSATAPEATINDLLGYWTLVADEISLSDSAFERLRVWRDELHWSIDQCPVTPARSQIVKRRGRLSKQIKRLPTPKSNKSRKSQSVSDEVLNTDSVNPSLSKKLGSTVKATKVFILSFIYIKWFIYIVELNPRCSNQNSPHHLDIDTVYS